MKLNYRLQQHTPEGLWTSEAVYQGEYREAVRAVLAGHLKGQPRAAVEEGTGRVVYALDARGDATAAAVKLFNTVVADGARDSGR